MHNSLLKLSSTIHLSLPLLSFLPLRSFYYFNALSSLPLFSWCFSCCFHYPGSVLTFCKGFQSFPCCQSQLEKNIKQSRWAFVVSLDSNCHGSVNSPQVAPFLLGTQTPQNWMKTLIWGLGFAFVEAVGLPVTGKLASKLGRHLGGEASCVREEGHCLSELAERSTTMTIL